ncbi:hypothetical protein AERO8C_150005 [Aeromonas veronii]|uniref:Uncharacterized protein n=1 Tax=Aeromonas veronii TaxID=654 RepID=A0A653KUV7_AERVE|nr:hypothetical protein AERO8C_150005 [Aeromonas veronii]
MARPPLAGRGELRLPFWPQHRRHQPGPIFWSDLAGPRSHGRLAAATVGTGNWSVAHGNGDALAGGCAGQRPAGVAHGADCRPLVAAQILNPAPSWRGILRGMGGQACAFLP